MQQRHRGRPRKSFAIAEAERGRILKAAEQLFTKQGYEGVSMRKVARVSGCSAAALYTLFPHKRALLRNIWEHAFESLDRSLSRLRASNAEELLKKLAIGYVTFWAKRPDHFRALFLIEDSVSEKGERYFVETSKNLPKVVARFQRAAQEAIVSRNAKIRPRHLVELIFCALHGVASAVISMPEYEWPKPRALTERMMDSLLNGLR